MSDLVEFTRDGAVGVITLDRPPVNAISVELVAALDAAIAGAEDDDIRSVVVTGAPHFAAGADIKQFQAAYESGTSHEAGARLSEAVLHLEALAKPTIAAVRGYALGGGLELAMGCDFRFLADDAQVGQPEIKLGIIPGAGGTQRLTRLVGLARCRDMVYSGRMVAAPEALEMGLADRVVPAGELEGEAMAAARTWAEGPTLALDAAKRAINGGYGRPLHEALTIEAEAFRAVFATSDAREGVDAFVEKREPRFSGS